MKIERQVSIVAQERPEECKEVLLSALNTSFGKDCPPLVEAVRRLPRFGSRGRIRRVALVCDRSVGFVDWDEKEIAWLMVRKEFQGLGIGGTLLQEVERGALGHVSVLCVHQNQAALRFYRRHGYEVVNDCVEGKMFGMPFTNYMLQKTITVAH